MKTIEFTVTKDFQNATVKNFLRYKKVSSRLLTILTKTQMGITRDNRLIKTIDRVNFGDKISINLPDDFSDIAPIKGNLDIIYEDDYLIAVNKPYNMPVHPTKIHQKDTLANILMYYNLQKGENFAFRAINRLDKDTSGIVLIAKDRFSASVSASVKKEYTAICEGEILKDGTVNCPIKVKEGHTIERAVRKDGERAITNYYVLKTLNNHTLIKCILETGRTHQIRCHMSYIGHPLAGDDMYGGHLDFIKRQALHCGKITFSHPVTEENIELSCPIPSDMAKLL